MIVHLSPVFSKGFKKFLRRTGREGECINILYSMTELRAGQESRHLVHAVDAVSFHLHGFILIIPVVLGTKPYLKLYVS